MSSIKELSKLIKLFFQLIELIAPKLGASVAYRFLSNPQIRKLRGREEEVLNQATQLHSNFRKFKLHGYQWGETDQPVALLIHGWEGQIGNFGALVGELQDKGYCVIGFDGPSHGKSTKASTSMFEYADFVERIVHEYTPKLLLTHSFGTVSAVFMLNANKDFKINQWFIITTPSDFKDRIKMVQDQIGMGEKTLKRMLSLLEKSTGHKIDDMNMNAMAPQVDQVYEIVIIHSTSDKITPIEGARTTHKAFKNSDLIELEGLGHYSILWSDQVKSLLKSRVNPAKLRSDKSPASDKIH
ncbi:MAG: alpha/beta hydrolase [Bacteroidota bacterium]